MRQKLYRGRRNVFRKRNPALRIVSTLLIAVAVVAVGFFGAKWFSEHPITQPNGSEQPTASAPTSAPDTSEPSTDTTPETPTDPSVAVTTDTLRGFYLPYTALTGDDLAATLASAKQAGFNAVIFDIKDAEGRLYYRFTSAKAVQVNSFTDNALTPNQLSTLFSAIRETGLLPIPRLYAFQDNLGAKALADARISHKDNSGWVWYDGKPANGAKAWLNPYASAAHNYIIDLATELKMAGAAAVMLDGVQFPKQTSSANFGTENRDLKQDEVLSLFVQRTREALGTECPVLLTCTAESALGTATQVYGGNPLTFGATMASPVLSYGTDMQDAVHKMILRTQVLEDKPTLAPLLAMDTLTAAQVNEVVGALAAGGTDCFILYAANGQYDFAAYTLP